MQKANLHIADLSYSPNRIRKTSITNIENPENFFVITNMSRHQDHSEKNIIIEYQTEHCISFCNANANNHYRKNKFANNPHVQRRVKTRTIALLFTSYMEASPQVVGFAEN